MITYLRNDKRGILLASCFLIVLFSVGAFYIIDSRKKEKEKLGKGASWGKSDYFGKYLEKLQ